MIRYVLRIIDTPGIVAPTIGVSGAFEANGEYIKDFDPSYEYPIGRVITTDDKAHAKQFDHPADALRFWKQEVGDEPRWDGKPNRPLTAFTVEVERA